MSLNLPSLAPSAVYIPIPKTKNLDNKRYIQKIKKYKYNDHYRKKAKTKNILASKAIFPDNV